VLIEIDLNMIQSSSPQRAALLEMVMSGFIETNEIDQLALSKIAVALYLVTYIGCLINHHESRLLFCKSTNPPSSV
jgi:hypothetical protein